jgi:hypothetical protein
MSSSSSPVKCRSSVAYCDIMSSPWLLFAILMLGEKHVGELCVCVCVCFFVYVCLCVWFFVWVCVCVVCVCVFGVCVCGVCVVCVCVHVYDACFLQ